MSANPHAQASCHRLNHKLKVHEEFEAKDKPSSPGYRQNSSNAELMISRTELFSHSARAQTVFHPALYF